MSDIPYIAFSQDNYRDASDMWFDIKNVIKTLVTNEYEVAFRYEDAGIYILEFGHDNAEYGTPMIRWIDPEEFEEFCICKNSGEGDEYE